MSPEIAQLVDLDRWYESYDDAQLKQQYEMLQTLIETPLSTEAIEDIDLGILLLEMREELVNHNQIDEAIAFIEKLQQQQPELYQEEYPYHDKFLTLYYLYSNQPEKVKAALERFLVYPEIGIDEMMPVLDDLRFYNAAEIAVDLCRSTYDTIANSPNAIAGLEKNLKEIIFLHALEQAYRQIQQGATVNWEKFWDDLANYGYKNTIELATQLPLDLTTEIEVNPQFGQDFKHKQSRTRAISHLSLDFCKAMFQNKQMSFVCAGAIWDTVLEFLLGRDLPPKKLSSPDSYFSFTYKELDRYVTQTIGSFFSMRPSWGVAALWGVPYVYDFLRDRGVIRLEIHRRAIAATAKIKPHLIENIPSLWKFDFVHRWLPTPSVSAEESALQSQKFANSLIPVKPLSDQPRPKKSPFLDVFKDQTNEDEDNETPPRKPTKPKKSVMKLAAELYAQHDKKTRGYTNS